MVNTSESPVIQRVRSLITPITSDLGLDLYDLEQRGGTLRVVLDTPAGADKGVDLETLALATRLVSRELDHEDPVPGRYTLEVTSPGVERSLRTPEHYRREIGKTLSIRLVDVPNEERRLEGVLVAADDEQATLQVDDPSTGEPTERAVPYAQIDRARTVFVWGPQPKPGGKGSAKSTGKQKSGSQKPGSQKSQKKSPGTSAANDVAGSGQSKEKSS